MQDWPFLQTENDCKSSSRASKRSSSTTWGRENNCRNRSLATVPRSYGVECAPDGSLVSFASDRSVRTWDLKRGKSVAQFAVELDLNGRGFALSADGTRVAVPNYDVKSIGIYERRTGKRLRNIAAGSLVGSPSRLFARRPVSGSDRWLSNRSAQVWDVDTGSSVLKVRARTLATPWQALSARTDVHSHLATAAWSGCGTPRPGRKEEEFQLSRPGAWHHRAWTTAPMAA